MLGGKGGDAGRCSMRPPGREMRDFSSEDLAPDDEWGVREEPGKG